MRNDKPVNNPRIQEALDIFKYICKLHDIAGAVYFCDKEEMGYAYSQSATWNAHIEDENTPMGFRIRARREELGEERAKELLEGSGWVLASMFQFGNQTRLWAQDLIKLLGKAGMKIDMNFPKIFRIEEGYDLRDKNKPRKL
jgi:hypothetical protein